MSAWLRADAAVLGADVPIWTELVALVAVDIPAWLAHQDLAAAPCRRQRVRHVGDVAVRCLAPPSAAERPGAQEEVPVRKPRYRYHREQRAVQSREPSTRQKKRRKNNSFRCVLISGIHSLAPHQRQQKQADTPDPKENSACRNGRPCGGGSREVNTMGAVGRYVVGGGLDAALPLK